MPLHLQVQYSWLWKLANVTQSPYSYVWMNDTNTPEIINGPSKKTMYVTALYFTMTCMTVSNHFHLDRLARVHKNIWSKFFFGFAPGHCLDSHSINHKFSLFFCLPISISLKFIDHLLIGLQQNSRYVLQMQCSVLSFQCSVCCLWMEAETQLIELKQCRTKSI